jgi:hypothetical protein
MDDTATADDVSRELAVLFALDAPVRLTESFQVLGVDSLDIIEFVQVLEEALGEPFLKLNVLDENSTPDDLLFLFIQSGGTIGLAHDGIVQALIRLQ